MILPIRGVRRLGGKPAKTGGDVDAAAKERPEEAPFAALRPHDYRLRTWSRRPTAKPARPKKIKKLFQQNVFLFVLRTIKHYNYLYLRKLI